VRRRFPTLIIAGLLIAVALAFWQRRMVGTVSIPHGIPRWSADLYEQQIPVWTYAYRGSSLLPWWNPYQLAGVPLLAPFGIGGLLYPVSLLATVVPVPLAIGYASAIHLALAGLLTLACGLALGLALPAAALSAAAFMLDAAFLAERIHPSYLFGLAWIPGVFLFAGRAVAAPSAWAGCLLGIVVALQLLVYPQIVCFTGYALLLLVSVRLLLVRPSRPYLRRLTIAGSMAVATAALLSAGQWLPTLELVAQAGRGPGGQPLEQLLGVPPPDWRTLLHPSIFSAGPVALLVPWAFSDRRRPVILALGTLLLTFAVLVGFGTPFYGRIFYHLPAVNLFRLPTRILPLASFAIAMLAGVGLDKILRHDWKWHWPRALVITAAGAAILLAAWRSPPSVVLPLAAVALAGAAVLLPWPRVRVIAGWAIVLLLVVERWSQPNYIMLPQSNPPEFFTPPPFVRFLREHVGVDRIVVIKDWNNRFPIMEKMGTLYGLRVAQDYEPLTAARYHDFLAGFDDVNVDNPAFGGRFFPGSRHPAWNRLDLLGVRYVVVAPGIPWQASPTRFRVVYQGKDATIYENMTPLPRAFLAPVARVETDPKATLQRMSAADFDPLAEALVDDEVSWNPAPPDGRIPREVVFGPVGDDAVVLHVSTPAPAVLVLTDLFWPGWRVTVDGDERPVRRVDYLFRGVAIEPGVHVVRFWYDPLSVKLGLAISAGSIALLVAAARAGSRRVGPCRATGVFASSPLGKGARSRPAAGRDRAGRAWRSRRPRPRLSRR
jgi:hypothetical protein